MAISHGPAAASRAVDHARDSLHGVNATNLSERHRMRDRICQKWIGAASFSNGWRMIESLPRRHLCSPSNRSPPRSIHFKSIKPLF
jgi:hypothetical protein